MRRRGGQGPAAKKLGWTKISATIIEIHDKADMLAIEIDENVQRLAFDDADLAEAYKKLQKLRRKNIFVRIWLKIKEFFKKLFGKKEAKQEAVQQEEAKPDEPVEKVSAENKNQD